MLEDFLARRESETVMQDRLWRLLFGRPVQQQERQVISLIPIVSQCDGGANSTNAKAALMLDLEISEPTARKLLNRCVDLRYVEKAKDQSNATRTIYRLPEQVLVNLRKLERTLPLIADVVSAQSKSPSDYQAGKSLLPTEFEGIYFNARDPEEIAILRAGIAEIAAKMKESKVCTLAA